MRIAVDGRMINASGIGKVIENVLKRMVLLQSSWQFFVLGRREELEQFDFMHMKNVDIIQCCSKIYSLREQIEFFHKIPAAMDWFWSPHYNIPLFYRGRMLVTIHDVFHLAHAEFVNGLHKRLYAKLMFAAVVQKADKIVCVSEFTARELQKYTKVDKEKLKVIYNGVDEKWFHVVRGERLHVKPYFIFVGNIKPHKNLQRLLDAFYIVQGKIKQDLILVGKKDGFITGIEKLDDSIARLGDRVHFTGYVSDEVLHQYVRQADAMIFPSLYEGFGLPPLEAMACGIPVMVSNVAALPEICGEQALYCDPYNVSDLADKMLQITYENKIEHNFYEYAKKYSWDITVEKMIKLFQS
jgi:glycosyltransferase involved in cell wall biosynthesis